MLYGLFALNLFLAWTGLVYANPAMAIALRVALGLGYAFAPFLMALLLAGLLTKHHADPTARRAFLTNLEITWSLTLVLAGLGLMASLEV
jgi:hypothetical protein